MIKKLIIVNLIAILLSCTMMNHASAQDAELVETLQFFLDLSERTHAHGIDLSNEMNKQGKNPISFANALLEDVRFSEYWFDALYLLASAQHKNDPVDLADRLISFFEKKEDINTYQVIKSKGTSINILKQLVGPNFMKNESLNKRILSFAESFFKNNNPTDPKYWYDRFDLTDLTSFPLESLNEDQQRILHRADANARISLQLAGFIHKITSDEFYLNIVRNCMNSEKDQIRNTAKFILNSDAWEEGWNNGRFELFNSYYTKPAMPSQEEIEKALTPHERVLDKKEKLEKQQ